MGSDVTSHRQGLQGDGPWDISEILKLPSTNELIAVLGEKELKFAFDEYLELQPSRDPIAAEDYVARIVAMLGWPEPTYRTLYKGARDPPTDEPWPEALFVYRVMRHLESNKCKAASWVAVDYYRLPSEEERRRARVVAKERYKLVLEILARLQEDRHNKALASIEQKIRAEVELIAGEGSGQ